MTSFGPQTLGLSFGTPIAVLANLDGVKWAPIGLTIDWTTVTAVTSADVTLPDGLVVKIGYKGLRYGQVLCKITGTATQTVTQGGTVSGGTYTLTAVIGGVSGTTSALAYNASAATVQTALEALATLVPGDVTVTGSAGALTITYAGSVGVVPAMTYASSLTGTSPTITVAVTNAGTPIPGGYGPYDASATDGRQTLTRSSCYILNETVLELGWLPTLGSPPSNHPGGFNEGLVWYDRLLISTATNPLAATGPTLSALDAVTRLNYVNRP